MEPSTSEHQQADPASKMARAGRRAGRQVVLDPSPIAEPSQQNQPDSSQALRQAEGNASIGKSSVGNSSIGRDSIPIKRVGFDIPKEQTAAATEGQDPSRAAEGQKNFTGVSRRKQEQLQKQEQ
eukprot:jgi/Chrzof1/10332/Cz04g38060.t1